MKIIKEGAFKVREYQETCRCCGCVFLFTEEDVDIREQSRAGRLRVVKCPWCQHILYVGQTMDSQNQKYDDGVYAPKRN